MAKANVDSEIAKLLTGHSIGVRGRYLNYSEEDLLQEYLRAIDLLTINETSRLKKKVDVLKEKEDEIEYLREQMSIVHSQLRILALKLKDARKFQITQTHKDKKLWICLVYQKLRQKRN